MAITPAHIRPTSKKDCVDTWRARGRIPVPTKAGNILELTIETLYETTYVDGLHLDLLVEGRAVKASPLKRFGVLFSDTRPEDEYPIPLLWMCNGVGSWVVS